MNQNPLFTLIPESALKDLRKLASHYYRNELLRDYIGKNILLVAPAVMLLAAFTFMNGYCFSIVAATDATREPRWITVGVGVLACVIFAGGFASAFAGQLAFLEWLAGRNAEPAFECVTAPPRLFQVSTWIPVGYLVALPCLFNLFFVPLSVGAAFAAILAILAIIYSWLFHA